MAATLLRFPTATKSLLGLGGSTTFWDAASFGLVERAQHPRRDRRILVEVRRRSTQSRAAPRRSRRCARPRRRDAASSPTRRRRRVRVPAQRNVDGRCRRPYTGRRLTRSSSSTARRPRAACASIRSRSTSYYFAPQKCFASDGGLWLALCSPAALERIERLKAARAGSPATLDLSIAVENSRLDQTYNTPALATLFLLDQQLQWMLDNGGLEFAAGRCDRVGRTPSTAGPTGIRYATPFVKDPDVPQPGHRDDRLRRTVDAAALGVGVARERHRRRRAVPQTRPESAPDRAVPRDRSRRRRDAHPAQSTSCWSAWQADRMLLLHEVHTVVGPTRRRVRRRVSRRLDADARQDDDARLLYYLKLAHGTGRAYHHTTITAFARRRRLRVARAARADRRPTQLGRRRRRHASRGQGQDAASRRLVADARSRSRDGSDRRTRARRRALHGRQRVAARSDARQYLENARTHYAPSLEARTERSLLTLLAVFQAALGAPRRREVILWQRVDFPERLPGAVHARTPGPREGAGHVDARRVAKCATTGKAGCCGPRRGRRYELVPSAAAAAFPHCEVFDGSGASWSLPQSWPPSAGHSPLNTPHAHVKPGATHACTIHMSVSSVLRPPIAEHC